MRFTGDRVTGQLLGVQLFGHRHAEIAKRVEIAATAIFHGMTIDAINDFDLSYPHRSAVPGTQCKPGPRHGRKHHRAEDLRPHLSGSSKQIGRTKFRNTYPRYIHVQEFWQA
jgi:hypothetical protein